MEERVFSAAQAAWSNGEDSTILCAGDTLTGPVTPHTLFDIASLTKVYTASACLRIADRGTLPLESRLVEWVPLTVLGDATIVELLAHEAGFAACPPLYTEVKASERGSESARRQIMNAALTAKPADRPGARCLYSDLGFIILARMLESLTERSIDTIIQDEVFSPLGLAHTAYRPLFSAFRVENDEDIAPTAPDLQPGIVHDDNARAMGGLSAHAGLFATALDVCLFGSAWLTALTTGEWLSVPTAKTAVQKRPLGRGLGWDFKSDGYSSAGTKMSGKTFGHLGFTGCSLWIDPTRELSIVLLTNRVFYGNDNNRIRDFRPLFHDALLEVIG